MDSCTHTLKEAKRWATKNGLYNFYKQLGESTFGDVLQAKRGKFGPIVAVSILLTQRTGEIKLEPLEILWQFSHVNIVCVVDYYHCYDPPGSSLKMVKSPIALSIVMQHCLTRDLGRYLQSYTVSETTRLRWYTDLLRGLEFLHERNIYHGDINPQNVWIEDDKLKLAHAGIAGLAWETPQSNGVSFGRFMSGFKCSKPFVPPEAWNDEHSLKSDIFSLGLVFIVIAEAPDKGFHQGMWNSEMFELGKLLHKNNPSRTVTPTHLIWPPIMNSTPQETKLFDKILQYNIDDRPDARELLTDLEEIHSKPLDGYLDVNWVKKCAC